jgi:hypothetical protein
MTDIPVSAYATHNKSTRSVNPVKWSVDWDKSTTDKDGNTILMVDFHHQHLGSRTKQTLSLAGLFDNQDLNYRLDDLADKHKFEMELKST